MRTKTLKDSLLQGDYAEFVRFLHSSKMNMVASDDEVYFYINAPEEWIEALLSSYAPSRRAERAILQYRSEKILNFSSSLWRLYPQTIIWALREGSPEEAEKIVNVLPDKPSPEAEVAMLRRSELELFKLWLEKFGELEDDAERLINEDPNLASLKSHYIDWELSR